MGARTPLKDRLERNLQPVPFAGCWLWTGATIKAGRKSHRHEYGVIGEGGDRAKGAKVLLTHRAAWMVYRGPIPDGMHVCHTCDVPLCVNPYHLFLGTRSDNMRDAAKKGRLTQAWKRGQYAGSKNRSAVLNELSVLAMRQLRLAGWKYEDLAEAFGVSHNQVFRICTGRSWQVQQMQ